MKKILFAILSIFALTACSFDDVESIQQQVPTDGTVVVQFGVQLPEMQDVTRSMTSPRIDSLHLVVFDEQGYLVEAVDATVDGGATWEDGTTTTTPSAEQPYTVELRQSASPRIIHFIANSPLATEKYTFGTERELINALETSAGADAYWQRKELNSILGNKVNEDGSVEAISGSPLALALNRIPLIRNFAKVSFTNNATTAELGNFTDVSIAVYNAPQKGKVAPYNTNSGEYAAYAAGTTYASLNAVRYYGYEPTFADTDFANTGFAAVQYLYEYNMDGKRIEAGAKYPFVIIKGKYKGGKESYYKVDLTYTDTTTGEQVYYNILRNFDYKIVINKVLGDGYDTADKAAAAAASNNLSASVDTRNLLNISDGTSALYVEYVEKYITSAKPFTLKYKYVPNLSAPNTTSNGSVTLKGFSDDGAVISSHVNASSTTDANGFSTITITPKAIEGVKTQEVTLSAGSLSRTVKLISRAAYPLTIDCPEKVYEEIGQPMKVTLQLPQQLPEAIFPLDFVIVAEKLSLSPNASLNTLPVKTGLNQNGEEVEGGQYFGFVKTVEYDDYKANNNIVCYFKTGMAKSATTVRAYNPYFSLASDSFVNGGNRVVERAIGVTLSNEASYYGAGHEVTVTLDNLDATSSVPVDVTFSGLTQPTRAQIATEYSNGTHTFKLYTSDWNTLRSVKVSYDKTIENTTETVMYTPGTASATASKLYIPAGSLKATTPVTVPVSVKVGSTTASETITFKADRTNNAATVTIPGLADNSDDTEMTLSYTSNGVTATATTTVGAASSSSELNDVRFVTRKNNSIDVTLAKEASYYGKGRSLTATITVPDKSTADIGDIVNDYVTLTGFNRESYSGTINSAGELVITLNLITDSWGLNSSNKSDTRRVEVANLPTVTTDSAEITWTGRYAEETVNTLPVPAEKITWDDPGRNQVNLYYKDSNSWKSIETDIGNSSNNSTENKGFDIEQSDLSLTSQFCVRYGSYYSTRYFTVEQLLGTGEIALSWNSSKNKAPTTKY
ncbi:MAG: hypothetical protein IKU88_06460 [Alistipes sp.]|nr:hypothetical protein [Alistipes sp.]